jgi:phenylacetate-CoA ligase
LHDLTKFPTVTKEEIQSAPEPLIANNPPPYVKRTTSGSTGLPLTIAACKTQVILENLIWMRALFANGLRIRDKMMVINDPRNFPGNKSFLQRFGVMRSNYVSIFDSAESLAAAYIKYQPDIIKGYPSSIELLAQELLTKRTTKPRLIFTSAEAMDSPTRELLNSVAQIGVIDNYASSEFSLMAWECSKREGYHINIDNLAMEFISENEAVEPGESGEIVCTSLSNTAMPLIRYKIGDQGTPATDQCSCGVTFPLLKTIEGRIDDFLVSTNGTKIPPTIFFPFPFDSYQGIKAFKVIQEAKNTLKFQLVVTQDFKKGEKLEKATFEMKKVFGDDMDIDYEFLTTLDDGRPRKRRKIVSLLPKKTTLNFYLGQIQNYELICLSFSQGFHTR